MTIMLPDELAWILNMLGFNWPNIDEDELTASAKDHRQMKAKVEQAAAKGRASAGKVGAANEGKSVDAFKSRWGNVSEPHLGHLAEVHGLLADGLDVLAGVVVAAKTAVIVQLAELAAEVASAAAASVVTFGISDAAGLAATALTRIAVRDILKELEKQAGKFVEQMLLCEAFQGLMATTGNLASQEIGNYIGTQHGISLSKAGAAGEKSVADGAKSMANAPGVAQAASVVGIQTGRGLHGKSGTGSGAEAAPEPVPVGEE
ncbi:MAG: hypothetical protein FWE35_10210 [Streptosporangiales bacterium]|nr:hypothetical protein [Streptosporangiales bacterium]